MNSFFDISTQEKRERFLLIAVGIMLFFVVVPFCYSYFSTSISRLNEQKNKLDNDIKKLETEVKDEKHIKERLTELGQQSLPQGELAKSQYQNWLSDTAGSAGLRERKIDSGTEGTIKDFYKKYTFKLTCKGTLEQVAEFLRRFHKTNYLHLIRKISPTPSKNSNLMDIVITIEAVSVTKAQIGRTLRVFDKELLKITPDEKIILDEIKTRNLFTAYTPPRPVLPPVQPPPPPQRPPQLYQAPYCFVGTIVESEGKKQVWIDHRVTGKQYRLYEGESFRLEGVDCLIEKIDFDRIHVEADKQKFTIRSGKSFADYD
ncbi:MAG: hypothetical protein LBE18_06855 [Planctomycetaceae bacterium]|jgi:Tfp pilus assembly protein PilO|nr:hypothetical protein [Planctomycetaceae bacterium]